MSTIVSRLTSFWPKILLTMFRRGETRTNIACNQANFVKHIGHKQTVIIGKFYYNGTNSRLLLLLVLN